MGGVNGYGTLAQLQSFRRLERDFTRWGEMRLRVQALTDDEIQLVKQYAADAANPDQLDPIKDINASIAFGLVKPDLKPHDDLDTAVTAVQNIPLGVRKELMQAIYALTFTRPADVQRSFFVEGDSPLTEEITQLTTSP